MCEQTITTEQTKRLESIIDADEQAMELYIESMWMHDGIARLSSSYESKIDPTKFASSSNNQSDLETEDDDMVTPAAQQQVWQTATNPTGKSNASFASAMYAGFAILGVTLIAVTIWWIANSGQPLPIANNPNQSNTGESNTGEGQIDLDNKAEPTRPFAASLVTSSGVQREELSDGTIVIARKGTEYTSEKLRELSLEKGELFLIVAKSEIPFVVKTADGEVLATGTRFTVSTGGTNTQSATQAAVAQGNVILKSAAGKIELGAGQQGTLTQSEKPTRSPARRLSHLVNWAKDALKQEKLLVKQVAKENGLIAIDPYGQKARLSLRKYDVDVYIEDGIARTTIDQTFFNHNPWNTEGTFYFPLPPDASVSRLAMYVAGQLNEGGMVSRKRGQEIYTEILHQRRDPALLEMMEGNMFKMRIFPLEGRQEKRIFLSYTQNLDELYGTTKYWFPMDHTQDVAGELSIRVRVKNGAKDFEPGSSTHDMTTSIDGNDLVMEYSAEKLKPDQDFLLALLPKETPEEIANADEVRVAVCEHEGQNYLTARLRPDLGGNHDPEPRQWIVVNDVSASRSNIDVQAQRHVLKRLITEADDNDTVFLMDLSTTARNVSVKPVNVRSNEVKPLINHRPKRLIGATNIAAGLDAVQQVIRKFDMKNPHLVYLGDGVATDGEKAIAELPRLIPDRCKFVGIGIGKKVDSMFLQEAANQTGGMFTTINPNEDIDWRVFDLVASMNTLRMSNIRVTLLDENDEPMQSIAYPSSSLIAAGETLTVTALCDKKLPSKIQFSGSVNKRPVTKTALVENAKKGASYLPRLWAKLHIDDLLKSGMSNEEEIVALSKSFYVVTPFTSLIVLEDDKMYEEYDVERGRKDHWAMYDAPKEIEVIKEPVDWNHWNRGWRGFKGEESNIDTAVQPESIQQIVDNIQIRINAPFYLWNDEPTESRTGLYQICEAEIDSDSDVTRLMTLGFLLSAGQQRSAIEFGRGVLREPNSVRSSPVKNTEADKMMQMMSQLSDGPARYERQLSFDCGIRRYRSQVRFLPRLKLEPSLGVYFRQQGQQQPATLGFRFAKTHFMPVMSMSQSGTSSQSLKRRLLGPYQKAVSTRRARIQRDIDKYNAQSGHGWNGWNGRGWNSWGDSIDLNESGNFFGSNGLQEILEDVDFDSDGVIDGWGLSNAIYGDIETSPMIDFGKDMDSISVVLPGMEFGNRVNFLQNGDQRFQEMVSGQGGGMGGRGGGFGGGRGFVLSRARYKGWFEQPTRMGYGENRPTSFYAAVQTPIRSQPGMAGILAADLLHKRLVELNRLDVKNEKQIAEKIAIEVAISKMDQVGARMESTAMFWGSSGWGYQPRVQTFTTPTIQIYHGHQWSADLTRYADGLYSTEADMMNEVAQQFGSPEAIGSVGAAAKKAIEVSRSGLQPVAIRFDESGAEILVGPNDQFAFEHRNDMYLTELFVCDGKQILQSYDELGIVARRNATEMRLGQLRSLAPHLIQPADVLAKNFDVELVETNDDSFTLKLTVAKDAAPEEDSTKSAERVDDESEQGPPGHILIQADHQGRILNQSWIVCDETQLSIAFSYKGEMVTVNWKVKSEEETNEGSDSYAAKPLNSQNAFSKSLDQSVVIDMPLKKPSFYRKKLNELKGLTEADIAAKKEKEVPLKSGDEATNLLRHEILSRIQDFSRSQWGVDDETQSTVNQLIDRLRKHEQSIRRGDITLIGSANIPPTNSAIGDLLNDNDKSEQARLIKYFVKRHNGNVRPDKLGEEKGLIDHLWYYHDVSNVNSNRNTEENRKKLANSKFKQFKENFPDSQLMLAAAAHYQHFSIDRLLELNDDPNWASVALSIASTRCQNDEDKKKVATAFWKWQTELAKDDLHPVLVNQVIQVVKQVDDKRLQNYLGQRLAEIKQQGSIPTLLQFAEERSSWGDAKLADEAYAAAKSKLGLTDKEANHTLLKRFAFGTSLWAGGRHKEALEQFDTIVSELDANQIPLSPAFLAAMARLTVQTGDIERTVEFEERALAAEQPYLPAAINLNAFRQRYQWLWGQYDSSITKVSKNDQDYDAKVDAILKRASQTWDRWRDVDRENTNLASEMANLQMKAGRKEQAWEYLSTAIDQRPKDATTYSLVGQWYHAQGDLAKSVRWLGEAPQWDTANPQWIFEYASGLKEMGRKSEAKVQFKKIINGKWAPGLQQWAERAKQAL